VEFYVEVYSNVPCRVVILDFPNFVAVSTRFFVSEIRCAVLVT
jgi:hypothetical protein